MNDEEAPAAAVDTAIPQASNKNGSALNAVRDRKLSVVSKQYDMDGDGELNEAEQAMRNMDQSNRGFLRNEEVYKMMVDQLQMQKDLFKTKKVVAGLMVFVVILALSTLGTSFASAILAKDSTTNDQNELVSKETGEALATQTTAKVIVIAKDQELARRRKLECVKQQGQVTGLCNFNTLGTISEDDGQTMSRLCQAGQTVDISWQDGGGTVTRPICPGGERFHPDLPTFTYKYRGTESEYKSNMKITTAADVIDLVSQANGSYELMISQIGGQTDVVLLCNEGDEPVCGSDGTPYDCAAVAGEATLAAPPVQCQCFGVSGRNPADGCYEAACSECYPVECLTGHFTTDACCSQCTDLNNGFVNFPGVEPASNDDCADGYLFDASAVPNKCILCDASLGFAVVNGACACPEGTTEQDGTCVASSSGGGCQLEYLKCDSSLICTTQVKYCSDGATVNPDACNNCAYPICCDGNAPVGQADNPV